MSSDSSINPGDLIAFSTDDKFGALIRFGQRVFGRSKNWRYNHIAVVEELLPGDAYIIQAVRTIDRVLLSSYGETPHVVIPFPGDPANREDVTAFAKAMLGMKYGVFTVVMRALNYLSPSFVRITGERKGRMDCSVFGARAWEHGAFIFPPTTDVWEQAPCDLVDAYYEEAA